MQLNVAFSRESVIAEGNLSGVESIAPHRANDMSVLEEVKLNPGRTLPSDPRRHNTRHD